jgi:hypothetical protein
MRLGRAERHPFQPRAGAQRRRVRRGDGKLKWQRDHQRGDTEGTFARGLIWKWPGEAAGSKMGRESRFGKPAGVPSRREVLHPPKSGPQPP